MPKYRENNPPMSDEKAAVLRALAFYAAQDRPDDGGWMKWASWVAARIKRGEIKLVEQRKGTKP